MGTGKIKVGDWFFAPAVQVCKNKFFPKFDISFIMYRTPKSYTPFFLLYSHKTNRRQSFRMLTGGATIESLSFHLGLSVCALCCLSSTLTMPVMPGLHLLTLTSILSPWLTVWRSKIDLTWLSQKLTEKGLSSGEPQGTQQFLGSSESRMNAVISQEDIVHRTLWYSELSEKVKVQAYRFESRCDS